MKQFEYEITKHPATEFDRLTYFCSGDGECSYEQIPGNQMQVLNNILNDTGR